MGKGTDLQAPTRAVAFYPVQPLVSTPQTLLEGCYAAEFLSKHSEQMPDCFFHKPLKKCRRHRILRHRLQAAPLNSPKVRLQIPQIIGAIENDM